jgi:DNA-binding HxlR family transcriptional regulator
LLAASRCLSLFSKALDARVLQACANQPLAPSQLEEAFPWAPQSTMRSSLAKLTEIGALTRSPGDGQARGAAMELTQAGRELLPVAAALEWWLEGGPNGPIPLEDPAAQGIVRVLMAGWDSTVIRVLAEQPRSLIELQTRISELNYPALKRRLTKLRSTGMVVPGKTANGLAYEVSDWLRRAVVPLTLAGRWERRHQVGRGPIAQMDLEAAFMLALPLVQLSSGADGACGLAILGLEERDAPKRSVAGVALELKGGEVVSCSADAVGEQPTWALGTVDVWLEALAVGCASSLRVSGAKPSLANGIVKALHNDLFRAYHRSSPP